MKQIILVRHTEKEEISGFTHVEADPHLTEKGREQAEEIKDFLEKNNLDYEVVLTSLYNRAIETSEIINDIKDKKIIRSISFNEYFLRPDGGNVEGSRMGTARTMTKIYSLYDQYKTVLIVCHRSIGRSILQPLLNMKFEDLENYFVNYGDTYVLRYDNDLGDTNWRIINEFTPEQ